MSGSGLPDLPLVRVFGDPETARLLDSRATIRAWLDTERALAEVQAELGLIPADAARQIAEAAEAGAIDEDALADGMRLVGYPILPLIGQLSRAGSPELAAYVHWGATTQDIMDTGLALVAGARLRQDLGAPRRGRLLGIAGLADEHRGDDHACANPCPARGADDASGPRPRSGCAEFARHRDRLATARLRACRISLFGAGGTAGGPRRPERGGAHPGGARASAWATPTVSWHTARDSLAEAARSSWRAISRDLRQDRPGGDRPVPPRDRRAARGRGLPPRRLVHDAPEGQPDRERGRRGDEHRWRPSRSRR